MPRLRHTILTAAALTLFAAPSAHAQAQARSQHGPALPESPAPSSTIRQAPPTTLPDASKPRIASASITSEPIPDPRPEQPAASGLRPESQMPLGAPQLSDVLPDLSGQGLSQSGPGHPSNQPASQPTSQAPNRSEPSSPVSDIARTVAALLLVITLILALAWGVRRLAQKQGGLNAKLGAGGRAPSGVLEVLGRYPVGSKLTLVVLRFDRRVLLLAQGHGSSATMSTLCELADPTDVASVLSRVSDSGEVNAAFKEAIARAERDFETALTPPPPPAPASPVARHVAESPEGDRIELLDDGAHPAHEISPLRRRLDALRAGGLA